MDPYAKAQVRVIRLKKSKVKREKSRLRTVSGATSIRLDNKEMPSNNSNLAGKERYFRESERNFDEFPKESTYRAYRDSYLSPI